MQSVLQPAPFNVGDRVRYQGEMCLGGASPNDPVGHYDPNDYYLVPGIEGTVTHSQGQWVDEATRELKEAYCTVDFGHPQKYTLRSANKNQFKKVYDNG